MRTTWTIYHSNHSHSASDFMSEALFKTIKMNKQIKNLLIAALLMIILTFSLVYSCDKAFVMPAEKRYEALKDSLSVYLGREVVIDSTPHILVTMSVLEKGYTTDKGIKVDYQFVKDYFLLRNGFSIDTNPAPEVSGKRIETNNGNE